MSGGIGHMCITMGIAEAIAITMMVTANNLRHISRLWPVDPAIVRIAAGFNCGDSGTRLFAEIALEASR